MLPDTDEIIRQANEFLRRHGGLRPYLEAIQGRVILGYIDQENNVTVEYVVRPSQLMDVFKQAAGQEDQDGEYLQ